MEVNFSQFAGELIPFATRMSSMANTVDQRWPSRFEEWKNRGAEKISIKTLIDVAGVFYPIDALFNSPSMKL